MKWSNLKTNMCPKDGSVLSQKDGGLECGFVDGYYQTRCTFFITYARARELKDSMVRARAPRTS